MFSIWFFVALGVAFIAVYLLRHADAAKAVLATKCQDADQSHAVKIDPAKRSSIG